MAVVRFTLPASELRVMAALMKNVQPQAARELGRAATRPGLTAELGGDEFKVLYKLAPWATDTYHVLEEAAMRLAAAQAEEAARPRGTALGGPSPHASYHARRKAKLAKRDKRA